MFSKTARLPPALWPLINSMTCLSRHCSLLVLVAAGGFSDSLLCVDAAWLLAALFACAVTETDGWNNRGGRKSGAGSTGGGLGGGGAAIKERQAMTQRFWSAAFSYCQPVCVANNLLTPHWLIRHLCWSLLGLVTPRPDPDKVISQRLAPMAIVRVFLLCVCLNTVNPQYILASNKEMSRLFHCCCSISTETYQPLFGFSLASNTLQPTIFEFLTPSKK